MVTVAGLCRILTGFAALQRAVEATAIEA